MTVRQLPEGDVYKDLTQIRVSKVGVKPGSQKIRLGAQLGATKKGRTALVFLQATPNGAL
jgi:hypothetical protein